MQHTVRLVVKADAVRAEPNPLPGVRPGDKVVFQLAPLPPGRQIEVEFHEVRTACEPQGPFVSSLQGTAAMAGLVAQGMEGMFIYRVFAVESGPIGPQRTPLTWVNGLDPGGNFGGVDVPKPPPEAG